MLRRSRLLGGLCVLGGWLLATPARADVLPPDACDTAGASCQTAGPNADQAGICTATTCSRMRPDGNGGLTKTEQACTLCMVASAPTGVETKPTPATPTQTSDGGMKCSLGPSPDLPVGALVFLGAAALLVRRRR